MIVNCPQFLNGGLAADQKVLNLGSDKTSISNYVEVRQLHHTPGSIIIIIVIHTNTQTHKI